MHKIIKNVIMSGKYELSDILKKIDTLWLQSDITDAEKEELINLAREHCRTEMGYAPLQKQIDNLKELVCKLEERIKVVENPDVAPEEPEVNEYPDYTQPTGAHDAYYTGDKITHNGQHYVCIAPAGYGVTYPPDVLPGMWQLAE